MVFLLNKISITTGFHEYLYVRERLILVLSELKIDLNIALIIGETGSKFAWNQI